jgi:starvation-inducible DNA-binding protein
MEKLIEVMKQLLADNIALGFKAQGHHWNVEGKTFYQYHEFFEEIYEDFASVTDEYAEWIRMMGEYAPYRLADFFDLATIAEPQILGNANMMVEDLYMAVEKHKQDLIAAGSVANEFQQNGLMDFLASRQGACQKWSWQLSSSLKGDD